MDEDQDNFVHFIFFGSMGSLWLGASLVTCLMDLPYAAITSLILSIGGIIAAAISLKDLGIKK